MSCAVHAVKKNLVILSFYYNQNLFVMGYKSWLKFSYFVVSSQKWNEEVIAQQRSSKPGWVYCGEQGYNLIGHYH